MLDEQLIHQVQNHPVIYNRQKYFINNSDPKKYLSKEDAWHEIAVKLNSDVETCKKRWKYLRERYVQQRKQGDPPNYEHLSRPYLDKMKFLDKHIQPRKSYKQVTSFLPSPSANGSFPEFMDSSRSNGSLGNTGYHNSFHENKYVKEEPQSSFQNFTTADLSSSHQIAQQHQRSHSQQQNLTASHHQQSTREFISSIKDNSPKRQNNSNHSNTSHTNNNGNTNYRNNGELSSCHIPVCPPSSSSSLKSIKSPLSSPQQAIEHHNHTNLNELKRPRIDIRSLNHNNNNNHNNDNDDDSSDNDDEQDDDRNNLLPNLANNFHNLNGRLLHNSNHHNDLFAMFQQQFTQHHQQQPLTPPTAATINSLKCSEQLLGELVTSELLKMTKDRQRVVQRKILEILFFDD